LRFLQEGSLIRLGGREIIPVNVRIIAATNKNLLDEVKKGNFRLDLYYRIKVIDIKIPSLKERKEDIDCLVDHFIKTISPKLGKEITHIDDDALEMLRNYEWPGNVRELSNVIERAINLAEGSSLTVDGLPPEIGKHTAAETHKWGESLNKHVVEAQLIKESLKKHNGSKTEAAKELGMSRNSIYRKIRKYSL
jgi:transcriptional regulator with PAS, ATPase and Fis domain